ncbi:MAG: PEGA domain-containing protein [Methanoregula sp.]|jgi:hypothetical protein
MNKKMWLLAYMVLTMVLAFSSAASAIGNITVSSVPAGATILVDGISTGTTTPAIIESVSSGSHYVLLRLTGYQDYTQNVIITDNATSTVSVTLIATETTTQQITNGSIKVESNPSNAAVFLNTEYQGKTPLTLYNITHGTYRVLVQKIGYLDWSDRISVTSGTRTDMYATLQVEATDTTIVTAIPTAITVKPTISKTSTVKVPTPWPSATPTPSSSMSSLAIIGAVGFGFVVLRK